MPKYRISRKHLEHTFEEFRACGQGVRECQVLWTSPWNDPFTILEAVHPRHSSHAEGFEIDDTWLNHFWLELAAEKHGIRAQVHTHQNHAFHSKTDDRYPIVHVPGFLSLVVPNFGMGLVDLEETYLARVNEAGRWKRVAPTDFLEVL